eukprot:TRINITY_DN4_c0_g3_i1.p1 TRINITY_DN4_c0_g3~~TRINITY_DN4_c0_g3_i1.p1  ORF type:complete len:563 (+),score=127.18 TRINITY_DN4_c0_g3_i1:23-1690(+)
MMEGRRDEVDPSDPALGGAAGPAEPAYDPNLPAHYMYGYREPTARMVFDGKRMRKAISRKTIDYNAPITQAVLGRATDRDFRDFAELQPHYSWMRQLLPPSSLDYNPSDCVCTRFVHASINKVRCPINCLAWSPEGRRVITGASSGEFTLWNGMQFNFETILQAHEDAVRCMVWTHNGNWMVTGDNRGVIKYWQTNMNNVKAFTAHTEPLRDVSFCASDLKFASCSDEGNIKIWDFARCKEESSLLGHGWDVKSVSWHPYSSMLISGSKDHNIKVWDVRTAKILATLHAHTNTVYRVRWNQNGNWFVSASRDHLLKLFDIRMMKELMCFRGHKREVATVAWHPIHEDLFASAGFEGSIFFWFTGNEEPAGEAIGAHDSSVWDLAWHPVGHILVSCSNDYTTKFWCRNRPGDSLRDKYNSLRSADGSAPDRRSPNASFVTELTAADASAPAVAAAANVTWIPGQVASTAIPGIAPAPARVPAPVMVPAPVPVVTPPAATPPYVAWDARQQQPLPLPPAAFAYGLAPLPPQVLVPPMPMPPPQMPQQAYGQRQYRPY